jgi:hypothetical protein
VPRPLIPRRARLDSPGTLHHVGLGSVVIFVMRKSRAIWGHPLDGRCQEAKTFPRNKFLYFLFFNSPGPRSLLTRPCSLSFGYRTSWSAPVIHQVQGSGVIPFTGVHLRPLANQLAPENCRYHAVSKVLGFTDPLALPCGVQPFCGSRRGRTIESQHHRVVYIRDGTAANQILWF